MIWIGDDKCASPVQQGSFLIRNDEGRNHWSGMISHGWKHTAFNFVSPLFSSCCFAAIITFWQNNRNGVPLIRLITNAQPPQYWQLASLLQMKVIVQYWNINKAIGWLTKHWKCMDKSEAVWSGSLQSKQANNKVSQRTDSSQSWNQIGFYRILWLKRFLWDDLAGGQWDTTEGVWETAASSLQPAVTTWSKKGSQYPRTSVVHAACKSPHLIRASLQGYFLVLCTVAEEQQKKMCLNRSLHWFLHQNTAEGMAGCAVQALLSMKSGLGCWGEVVLVSNSKRITRKPGLNFPPDKANDCI